MKLYEREVLRKLKVQLIRDPFSYDDYLNGCRIFMRDTDTYYNAFVEPVDKNVNWSLMTIVINQWICAEFEKKRMLINNKVINKDGRRIQQPTF